MPFTLPPLPYAMDALEPHMSKRTLEFHYGGPSRSIDQFTAHNRTHCSKQAHSAQIAVFKHIIILSQCIA
jgi:superoxide dismutase